MSKAQEVNKKKQEFANMIHDLIMASADSKIADVVEEQVKKQVAPKTIKIEVQNGKLTEYEGREHYLFPLVLKIITAKDVNLALTGPAGSGKTSCLIHAAKAMDRKFFLQPFNIMSTKSDILGYMDANGKYVESAFYQAFKDGGLFIADEFDCCHPAVGTLMNAAIANRVITFANNETIQAHDYFAPAVCMNTVGAGATTQYVGRNQLDAATLDRFAMLHFEYDGTLEAHMIGVDECMPTLNINKGGTPSVNKWLSMVRAARESVERLGYQSVISPRASLMGVRLAEQGIGETWLKDLLLFKGLSENQTKKLKKEINKCLES